MSDNYVMGLRPLEDTILVCTNCDRELVTVTLVSKEFPQQWVFQATCPCGDSSEALEVQGKYFYNGVAPLQVVDVRPNKVGDVFEMLLVTKEVK